jgi:PilZ domain
MLQTKQAYSITSASVRKLLRRHPSVSVSKYSAIDCTVRNLSKLGAALNVASPVGIPDEFVLVIPSDGLRLPCQVVWRKPDQIGIRFRPGTRSLLNQTALKKATDY